MKSYRTEAIILKTTKFDEAHKIITLLTYSDGLKRAIARNSRKTNTKFGARVEPFNCIDTQIYKGKNLDTIMQAELIYPNSKDISKSLQCYTAANVICELTEKLTHEDEKCVQLYNLLRGGLYTLANKQYHPMLVANSYCLRAMAISGWAPTFDKCIRCGNKGWHSYFNIEVGGALCEDCKGYGSIKLSYVTVKLMADLLIGNWDNLENVDETLIIEVTSIVTQYTQWHLEKKIKSAQFQTI